MIIEHSFSRYKVSFPLLKIRVLFIFLLGISSNFLFSQDAWKFSHLSTDEGLSTGTANCVIKDSRGFIWIGTLNGLNRYNGYSIDIFRNDKNDSTSIPGNIVNTLTEDENGQIWIGTRSNGISVFDWNTETFRHIKPNGPEGLPPGQIKKIVVGSEGRILVANQGGGLCVYSPETNKFKIYQASSSPTSISNSNVFSILQESENRYWIGTHSGGIDLFDLNRGTFEYFEYDRNFSLTSTSRKALMKDSRGNLWIGTDGNGLVKFSIQSRKFETLNTQNSGLKSNIVVTMYEGANGKIYVGTDGAGLNIYDPSTEDFSYMQSSLFDQSSLSSDAIYDIYRDDSGVIWVSTFRGGVNIYSPLRTKFHLFEQVPNDPNSLAFNSVIALEESSDGYIWIGTDGGGLDRLDPKTRTIKHHQFSSRNSQSISSNVAIALAEDSEGFLWVGTYAGGLNRYDPRTGRFKRYLPDPNDPNSLHGRNVWEVTTDSRNNLWVGLLDGGLDLYDPSTDGFTQFSADGSEGSLSSNLTICMMEDSRKNFWVGTEDGGLNLFDRDRKKFRAFQHIPADTNSIMNNNIRSLLEDSKGQLWIGTAEGMNVMDLSTMKITASKVNKLLPSLVVNSIEQDRQGFLWISTNKGLSRYNPEMNEIRNFTTSDGLQGNEFNYNTSLHSSTGRMYFGGIRGLNDFAPQEVRLSTFNPKVVLTSIKLFDQSIAEYRDNKNNKLIEGSISGVSDLTLTHDQNIIEFEFSSLDYTSPLSNKYRFQLEGFDKDWVYTDANKRTASYTNLDPGTYTFKVQGTNSDGIWSKHERTIALEVLPPWWETLWFRALVAVILISLTIIIYRWRSESIKSQKRELERRVDEATSTVKEQNAALEKERDSLTEVMNETNYVIAQAVESGNFKARIDTSNKEGEWKQLGESINQLFDSVVIPFNEINRVVHFLAEGNLTHRYEVESKGESEILAQNLNNALDNMAELLRKIILNAQHISESSSEMMVTSEEMNISSGEIASSIAEMSKGAGDQVSKVDEVSRLLESILKVSQESSNQAQLIHTNAQSGTTKSKDGLELIAKVDQSVEDLTHKSNRSKTSIESLSERSREISNVIRIIKEIASQTNLLALNAAIEAAQAGDAGRGFAVVAEEIRKLAESSKKSAQEIESLITIIQDETASTATLITEMNRSVKEGEEASKKVSIAFNEIAESYQVTLDLSEKIVTATNSETDHINHIVGHTESVVVIAEQTAAGSEEIAASAAELSSGMENYSTKSKQVLDIIEELKEMVSQFQIESED